MLSIHVLKNIAIEPTTGSEYRMVGNFRGYKLMYTEQMCIRPPGLYRNLLFVRLVNFRPQKIHVK